MLRIYDPITYAYLKTLSDRILEPPELSKSCESIAIYHAKVREAAEYVRSLLR